MSLERLEQSSDARVLERLRWLAWFSDSAIRVPGTRWTFGADAALSLVPGVGSLFGTGLSIYLMLEALRFGVPARLLLRMGGNTLVDTVIGAIPGVGFLFDMFFKANQRNLKLLLNHVEGAS
jgi:hypothetical protein